MYFLSGVLTAQFSVKINLFQCAFVLFVFIIYLQAASGRNIGAETRESRPRDSFKPRVFSVPLITDSSGCILASAQNTGYISVEFTTFTSPVSPATAAYFQKCRQQIRAGDL